MSDGRPTVLVVDDDPIVLRAVSQPLLHRGYDVVAVESGARALEWLDDTRADLVILDVVMPEMSGYEVCELLRADPLHRDTPVIFLTSRRGLDDMARARAAGSDLYVMKPFLAGRLVNMVEMFISPDVRLTRRPADAPPSVV
jgi:CheY-like chemotaxis protein